MIEKPDTMRYCLDRLSAHELAAIAEYPDTDGEPMGDNTEHARWMILLFANLSSVFEHRADVFVAINLNWYLLPNRPDVKSTPDVLVAFGRPQGERSSYRQWEEDGVPPHVTFEIVSPGNTPSELSEKLVFNETYGVEEFYQYNPESNALEGWLRSGGRLSPIADMSHWQSPRLQIEFEWSDQELLLRYPDGEPFLSFEESRQKHRQVVQERDHIAEERDHIAEERDRIAEERDCPASDRDKLVAKLREAGIDPNEVL